MFGKQHETCKNKDCSEDENSIKQELSDIYYLCDVEIDEFNVSPSQHPDNSVNKNLLTRDQRKDLLRWVG